MAGRSGRLQRSCTAVWGAAGRGQREVVAVLQCRVPCVSSGNQLITWAVTREIFSKPTVALTSHSHFT